MQQPLKSQAASRRRSVSCSNMLAVCVLIHSFNKSLLVHLLVSGTLLGLGDKAINKILQVCRWKSFGKENKCAWIPTHIQEVVYFFLNLVNILHFPFSTPLCFYEYSNIE